MATSREILNQIAALFLALVFCFGSTSTSVRAVIITTETETETVDPQEEKQLCQRVNESRLSRQKHVKTIWEILYEKEESTHVVCFAPNYHFPKSSKDFHIPILRAPPHSLNHA